MVALTIFEFHTNLPSKESPVKPKPLKYISKFRLLILKTVELLVNRVLLSYYK